MKARISRKGRERRREEGEVAWQFEGLKSLINALLA